VPPHCDTGTQISSYILTVHQKWPFRALNVELLQLCARETRKLRDFVANLACLTRKLGTYSPAITSCTVSLTFTNSTFCPHSVFMCFVWI
jgi:hypothetical protein